MKKLFFGLLFAASFGLTSCGGDEGCITCSLSVPLIGDTTQEICEDGDNLTVTTNALGIEDTQTIENISQSDYVSAQEAAGFSCN
ncbi:MAG: hypothetical protein AAF985_04885 [Bacteroidota bacterium]